MSANRLPQTRPDFGGLRCTVDGCRHVVHALTGLQEIQKLGRHIERKHKQLLGMHTLLELRVKMEAGETIFVRNEP